MIEINERSSTPIYQQIYENIIKLIVLKVMSEGDKLPSVRELALMLNINPNTIQKAYKALESNHYVTSHKGKGNFVNAYEDVVKLYQAMIKSNLKESIQAMLTIGVTKESLINQVEMMIKEIEDDRS